MGRTPAWMLRAARVGPEQVYAFKGAQIGAAAAPKIQGGLKRITWLCDREERHTGPEFQVVGRPEQRAS